MRRPEPVEERAGQDDEGRELGPDEGLAVVEEGRAREKEQKDHAAAEQFERTKLREQFDRII